MIGIKHIDFGGNEQEKGCTKIKTIPNPSKNSFKNAIDFSNLFYNCNGLDTEIPEYLFMNAPELKTLQGAFANSTIKGNLKYNLFNGLPNIESFRDIFYNCKELTGEIPEKLFAKNIKARDFQGLFAACSNLSASIPKQYLS